MFFNLAGKKSRKKLIYNLFVCLYTIKLYIYSNFLSSPFFPFNKKIRFLV